MIFAEMIFAEMILAGNRLIAIGAGPSSFTRSLRQMASFGLPMNAKDRLRAEILHICAL